MKIIDIKESGANNILMWAISNGADVKSDEALMSFINDELFYLVTLSDVNAFELYRLTQMYRDRIRIINEKQAEMPSVKELMQYFPSKYKIPEGVSTGNAGDEENSYELADYAILNFMNLSAQMMNDDDIIHSNAVRLFLPMIARKFDIQIPISFVDFISSMNEEEAANVFNKEYPSTLPRILEEEVHGLKTTLSMGFVKGTQIIKYDQRYDKYMRAIKYAPLKSVQTTNLCKYTLLGFKKYDNISRTEIHCTFFKANPNGVTNVLRRMKRLDTPLELEFVVQMPIQYMQLLENSFGRDILTVSYESSMTSIIDNGIIYEDFKTIDISHGKRGTDEANQEIEEYHNQIDAYRVRIAEANQILLNAITAILKAEDNENDVTSAFSMIPSIYMTSAVLTISSENIQKFIGHTDPILSNMFSEMSEVFNSVANDIRKA